MAGRRITFLILLLVAFVFAIAYQEWLAWFLLVALAALPLFSLLVSLPALLLARFRLEIPHAVTLGQPLDAHVRCKCPVPAPVWQYRLQVENRLSGQRQRYQYYGFDHAGYQLRANLETVNVRHALRDICTDSFEIVPMNQAHAADAIALMERQSCFCARSEEAFVSILRTWYNEPFAVMNNGVFAGCGTLRKNPDGCHIAELLLEDEADFPAVMKLLSGIYGDLSICAAPWERARARWLSAVCEEYSVQPAGQFKVYDAAKLNEICSSLDGFLGGMQPLYVAPPDAV